jgi:polar amino acid transport system substrate-binding protein
MTTNRMLALIAAFALAGAPALADDAAAKKELTPSGKLRVGVAIAASPGAGNVAVDAATGRMRGFAIELGEGLAKKLDVPVEFVRYPHSGALTDAAEKNEWDVAFIPVDDERRKKVDFGAAHIVLQSTYLVGPDSPAIQALADVDKPGVRVVGVENTATARAAASSLKNTTITHVKSGDELFERLRSGQADAIAQSRESLSSMATRLPGSRVLDGAFLNSYVALAMPKNKPAALAYASAFVEDAKASGAVRRMMDDLGMKSSVVAPAGVKP